MEVGSLRERIIVALLTYRFGEENVETDIPITEREIDARLCGEPISIKTITGKNFGGVKLIWTVDAEKALEFRQNYRPHCDLLVIQVNWNETGLFCHIPVEAQRRHFDRLGRDGYMKLPKPGTNPRGVEITKEALSSLVEDKASNKITIRWHRVEIDYNPYERWVQHWEEE